MAEKSISEQVIDEFINSLGNSDLFNAEILDKLKGTISSAGSISKTKISDLLELEDKK
jgi:hypothetical protein